MSLAQPNARRSVVTSPGCRPPRAPKCFLIPSALHVPSVLVRQSTLTAVFKFIMCPSWPVPCRIARAACVLKGPALLVRNDAVFSEADFESISRVGDSVKRGQAGKTGLLLPPYLLFLLIIDDEQRRAVVRTSHMLTCPLCRASGCQYELALPAIWGAWNLGCELGEESVVCLTQAASGSALTAATICPT